MNDIMKTKPHPESEIQCPKSATAARAAGGLPLVLVALLALAAASGRADDIPGVINYQGKL
jgi:hypothetical protein